MPIANQGLPHLVSINGTTFKLEDDKGFVLDTLDLSGIGTFTTVSGGFTRTHLSAPAARKHVTSVMGTIATTSTTDSYIIAPEAGTLTSVTLAPLVALAANDTNYITFTITNLGQAGAGSTAMLATSDLNTTKATGGQALAISTQISLTVHATAANVTVAAGDVIRIRATATGTLANTVTVPVFLLKFGGTT